jgi:hypothetical protein
VKAKRLAGRRRVATGWTLLLLGLLVAGVWGASGWWGASWQRNRLTVACVNGEITVVRSAVDGPGWWELFEHDADMRGINWVIRSGPEGWNLGVLASAPRVTRGVPETFTHLALWPIPLLLWTAGGPVLRSGVLARRRAITGVCGKCGYSLAGLGAGAPCPECGARATP